MGQDERVSVHKTYKLYMDGEFPRTESGRYLQLENPKGEFVANICRASRKDFRDSVVAAREALEGWFGRTAFNRGQILYRIAEMLEARRGSFEEQLADIAGYSDEEATREVDAAIDRVVWFAGWADKYNQIFGSTNPVASNHFNFTIPEPTGVVAIFAPQNAPLLGVISALLPVMATGNTSILIVDNDAPNIAIEFAEVINNSDVPSGVVNILTGLRDELVGHVSGHKDVNGLVCYGIDPAHKEQIQLEAAENVKRLKFYEDPSAEGWRDDSHESPYRMEPFTEFKTAWHPMGA